MIKVNVYIHPGGKRYSEHFGHVTICDDGTGTDEFVNYEYKIFGDGVMRDGRIIGHERSSSIWELIKKILCEPIGE